MKEKGSKKQIAALKGLIRLLETMQEYHPKEVMSEYKSLLLHIADDLEDKGKKRK